MYVLIKQNLRKAAINICYQQIVRIQIKFSFEGRFVYAKWQFQFKGVLTKR